MGSIYHKLYVFLGGKKGSFLQKQWAKFRNNKVIKRKSKLLPIYGMDMLRIFKEVCNELGVKGWLEYGTLLGAYRERSFIPHDYDLDVGMFSDDFTPIFENKLFEKGFVKNHEYYLVNATNGKRILSELGFSYQGFSIDIFLSSRDDKIRKSYVFLVDVYNNSPKLQVKYYTLNRVEPLSEVEINGESFNAPNHPEELLKRVYGEDFMIPQKDWKPISSNPFVSFLDINVEYGEHRNWSVKTE